MKFHQSPEVFVSQTLKLEVCFQCEMTKYLAFLHDRPCLGLQLSVSITLQRRQQCNSNN